MARQQGLVAVWQLKAMGHSRRVVDRVVWPLRQIHDGVYVSGPAPVTDWQRWRAATLTTSDTWLCDWSNATFLGMREGRDRLPITVVRRGSGHVETTERSPLTNDAVKVRRSLRLEGCVRTVDGMPSVAPTRTLLDLAGRADRRSLDRLVRNALRLRLVTPAELQAVVRIERGRRGVAVLRQLADEYAELPIGRTRSDAEALALAILETAGVPRPEVKVMIGGFEADLVWRHWRLIVELDGPQWHRFPTADARKTAAWRRAGFTVRRIPTDDVYDRPSALLDVACAPDHRAEGVPHA